MRTIIAIQAFLYLPVNVVLAYIWHVGPWKQPFFTALWQWCIITAVYAAMANLFKLFR